MMSGPEFRSEGNEDDAQENRNKVQDTVQGMKGWVPQELIDREKKPRLLFRGGPAIEPSPLSWRQWPWSWFTTKVKVYVQVTGQTSGAHETILDQLYKNNSTEVEITDNVEDSYLIIVFCPIGSRAGSDVAAAMGNLPVSARQRPVVLVPMHHTRDHDYSVGGKWSEDNPGVVLEVHVLFHETQPGLLPCDRNNKAVKQIQDVLNKYSKYNNSCNPL